MNGKLVKIKVLIAFGFVSFSEQVQDNCRSCGIADWNLRRNKLELSFSVVDFWCLLNRWLHRQFYLNTDVNSQGPSLKVKINISSLQFLE